MKKLNTFQIESNDGQQEEKKRLERTLKDIEREINNIVSAIAKGFTQQAFLTKMEELETQQADLTTRIAKIQLNKRKQPSQRIPYESCSACSKAMKLCSREKHPANLAID